MLANAVQGIVKHASSGRTDKPRSSGKPPSSPGPSSSSSSNSSGKSSKDKKPGKGGSDGGGSSPGGSPSGSGASSPSRSPIAKEGIDAYALEKKLMRVKTYESRKLPTLPKNAPEARTFKNGMFNVICKLAKADEAPAFKWISRCAKPDADLSDSSPYPVLDRVLGSKLLEMSKNTRFAMQFQTMQEEAQKHGRQPKGRKLLWVVFEKFKMEKDKGVSLTQSHLLGLKVQGNDTQALENFRNRFDYVWQALEVEERPSSSAIRSLLFEQLKNHPSMMLTIDKFRNASSGSSKRTYQWLYDKLIEAIEIHQLEENSSNLEKSLSQFAKVAANPSKPEKADKPDKSKKEKPEKPNKEKKAESTVKDKNKIKQDKPNKEDPEIDASAAPGTAKGKGKSSKGQGSGSAKGTKSDDKPDRTKKPCMYFAYNACSKGSNCPYLHDSKNLCQGPKPQALKDKQANAGAAHVNAGAGTEHDLRIKSFRGELRSCTISRGRCRQ